MANCMDCGGAECICRSVRERKELDKQLAAVRAVMLESRWPAEAADVLHLLTDALNLDYDYLRHEVREETAGCDCRFKPGDGSGLLLYVCGDDGCLCGTCYRALAHETAGQEPAPRGE